MAVQLQLENGEVKMYQTWYEKSAADFPSTYHTKCKMHWEKKPRFEEGCDHIECALKAHDSLIGFLVYSALVSSVPIIFLSGLIGPHSFKRGEFEELILFVVSCLVVLSVGIWRHYKNYLKHKELAEFRDHGTIKGIKVQKL